MKSNKFFLFILSFLLIGGLTAQVDLVSPKDFKAMMKSESDLVILDASKSKTYASSHIKGAVHVNHMDLYRDSEPKGVIMSPQKLADFFGKLGVGDDSKVVVYDEGSQKYSSRVYWILKYIGKDDVYVLHKDLNQWRSARLMLTAEVPSPEAALLTPNVNKEVYASLDEVIAKKDQPDYVLVDSRTADEFAGVSKSDGHIPGAINLNYEDLLTDTGAFKSKEELQKIANKNGLTPDKGIIFYCKTSVRATVSYIAFKNILGYENVKVYDGAYNEWVVNHSVVQ